MIYTNTFFYAHLFSLSLADLIPTHSHGSTNRVAVFGLKKHLQMKCWICHIVCPTIHKATLKKAMSACLQMYFQVIKCITFIATAGKKVYTIRAFKQGFDKVRFLWISGPQWLCWQISFFFWSRYFLFCFFMYSSQFNINPTKQKHNSRSRSPPSQKKVPDL